MIYVSKFHECGDASPPSLLPATKTPRLQQEEAAAVADTAERTLTQMDEEIAQHFLGVL